jgi:hypothetical protein
MKKVISCCDLDCNICDARIATISNDDELRKTTAEKWKTLYNATDLSYTMINCTGCREEGAKLAHAMVCEIRKCVKIKGFDTCGDCEEMEACIKVSPIHKYAPDAKMNLKNLN